MAFSDSTFATIGVTGFSNVHLYRTTDTVSTVTASGYFNVTTDKRYTLKQYDLIIMQNASGASNTLITVTSATGTSPITTVATSGL
jgi:hypothetical protein